MLRLIPRLTQKEQSHVQWHGRYTSLMWVHRPYGSPSSPYPIVTSGCLGQWQTEGNQAQFLLYPTETPLFMPEPVAEERSSDFWILSFAAHM